MTILITGATGAVGRHLVSTLVEAGESVRALSRTPAQAGLPSAVDIVGGDLADATSLAPAVFAGVDRVFVFPADRGVDHLADAAMQAGVERFVVLSSLAVAAESPRDVGSASYIHHQRVEQAITSRTSSWTILRPGTFANNLLSWSWLIKAGAPIRAPYVHSAQAPIHEADIADAAVAVLTADGHTGQAYPLTGPDALTKIEQVAAIGRALGRDIPLVEISPEEFQADMAQFIPAEIIEMLLAYWSDTVSTPDQVRDVGRLTGKPGRTLEQWAIDHRADFGG